MPPAEKLSFKQLLNTVVWTFYLGFEISPLYYSLTFANRILLVILPIAQAFFSSLVLGELITLVTNKSGVISRNIIIYLACMVIISAINSVMGLLSEYIYQRLNYLVNLKMYSRYLHRLANLDMSYHEDPGFKTKIKKADDALSWRLIQVLQSIASLIAAVVGIIFAVSIFLTINVLLVFLIIIPILLDYLINTKFGRQVWGIWDHKGDEKKHADHALNGLKNKDIVQEAKIYGFGSYLAKKYEDANVSFIKSVVKKSNQKYSFLALSTVLEGTLFGFIQIYLIYQAILGVITIQGYSFYLQSLNQVSSMFGRIQENISRVYEYSLYVFELQRFFEYPDTVVKPLKGVLLDNLAPTIEFKNVWFKYPNAKKYVLRDLSFKINPGEKISIVGENGAGKSTIIKLLARFYDVSKGEILVNGINIKELDLTSYYKLWGVLFQFFARYWFSVKENVGIGNIEDMENTTLIKQAIDKADAKKLVESLPHKYDNMLSPDFKDGTELSGGQWQKIGIARGMFADPKFIVLDEPTSALDALAEARVFEQIHQLANNTTMIIVSHRFATVRNADKILVVENGKISEQGSHDELMSLNGLYHEMFTTQAEGYK